jgi:hypothetical protein
MMKSFLSQSRYPLSLHKNIDMIFFKYLDFNINNKTEDPLLLFSRIRNHKNIKGLFRGFVNKDYDQFNHQYSFLELGILLYIVYEQQRLLYIYNTNFCRKLYKFLYAPIYLNMRSSLRV